MEVGPVRRGPAGRSEVLFRLLFPGADRPRRGPGPRPAGRGPGLPAARDRACPRPTPCRDSYLCPITQASPYFLAKAFPGVRFLSPAAGFHQRLRGLLGAGGHGRARSWARARDAAEQAWAAAVRAQTEAERGPAGLGQQALEQAVATGKPTILLAGHSYNAFTPEASQSVGKKLSSMGVPAIPADCLAPVEEGPTAWHFANQILNAVALAQRHPNLFLLCVSNFSCTVDAFTHSHAGVRRWAPSRT